MVVPPPVPDKLPPPPPPPHDVNPSASATTIKAIMKKDWNRRLRPATGRRKKAPSGTMASAVYTSKRPVFARQGVALRCGTATVTVVEDVFEPGVRMFGEKMQVAPLGNPEQLKLIGSLNAPPCGYTHRVTLPSDPDCKARVVDDKERLKSLARIRVDAELLYPALCSVSVAVRIALTSFAVGTMLACRFM